MLKKTARPKICIVLPSGETDYSIILKLAKLFLTFAVANAKSETGFSHIKRVENNYRSQLGTEPLYSQMRMVIDAEADKEIFKRGTLYVGHHGRPVKKSLGFRWSKKVEVTLETISFWQNIFISIFKFSPFLLIKACQFFKIY